MSARLQLVRLSCAAVREASWRRKAVAGEPHIGRMGAPAAPVRAKRCVYMKGRLAPRCGRTRATSKMSGRLQPVRAELRGD